MQLVAKSHVCNEITHVPGELLEKLVDTKKEIIEQANQLINAACDMDPASDHADGTIDFGDTAKGTVARMGVTINIRDEKLGDVDGVRNTEGG